MWLILTCGAIGFLWFWIDGDFWISEGLAGALLGLIIGVCFAMFVGGVVMPKEQLPPQRHNLVNIADNTEIHGTFFLLSGSIDETPIYAWYEKTGPNTYKRRSVDSDLAEIHYLDKDETPYYEIERFKYKDGFWQDWYLNLASGKPHIGTDYDFYVPRGTITNKFELDAQ